MYLGSCGDIQSFSKIVHQFLWLIEAGRSDRTLKKQELGFCISEVKISFKIPKINQ